jgi:hypothetical protein
MGACALFQTIVWARKPIRFPRDRPHSLANMFDRCGGNAANVQLSEWYWPHTSLRGALRQTVGQLKAQSAQPHALGQNHACFARHHDPVVCAAFALGGAGSSVCPPNFFRLDTVDACNNAAVVAGTTFGGIVTLPGLLANCIWVTLGSTFYFNAHPTGAANVFAQSLCAGAARCRASAGV